MDAEKALSLGMTLDAFKFSLGYVDTWSDMQIADISKAKLEFLQFYLLKSFTSLLDYYKLIALDLPTVQSPKEFDNLSMAVRIRNTKVTDEGKIFLGYEICHSYSFKSIGYNTFASATVVTKYYDKLNGSMALISGLWLQLNTDGYFLNTPVLPLYLPSFTKNKILINVRRFDTLNKIDAPCLDAEDAKNYSSYICALDCQNKNFKEKIGCQLFRYSSLSENPDPNNCCNFLEKLDYNNLSFSEFAASNESLRIAEFCLSKCRQKCDKIIYQSSLQWQQYLPSNLTSNFIYQNGSVPKWTYVEAYIEHSANYDGEILYLKEEATYSFTELINNIGGTLGLFIGATLMTFAQIILFFVDYFSTRRQRSVVQDIV